LSSSLGLHWRWLKAHFAPHYAKSRCQSDESEAFPELEIIYAYRDAKARLFALRELDAISIKESQQIDSIARGLLQGFRGEQQAKIAWLAREYIFNERLFPWIQPENRLSVRERYSVIYELADLTDRVLGEPLSIALIEAARGLELRGVELEDVLQILSRVPSYLQMFGYEHFIEDVTQDGGQ